MGIPKKNPRRTSGEPIMQNVQQERSMWNLEPITVVSIVIGATGE